LEKLHAGDGVDAKDMMAIGQLGNLKELKIEVFHEYFEDDEEDYTNAFELKQLINLQQLSLQNCKSFAKL
jgi:hypothetical protein